MTGSSSDDLTKDEGLQDLGARDHSQTGKESHGVAVERPSGLGAEAEISMS